PIYSDNLDYTFILLSPRILTDLPQPQNLFDTFLNQLADWNQAGQLLITNLSVDPLSIPSRLGRGQELWRLCEEINRKLQEHSDRIPWFHIIDLKGFLIQHGLTQLHDPRYEMTGRFYFHPNASKLLAEYILRYLRALTVSPKKLLAIDLDNTLWGGVLGEDGLNGIRLGGESEGYAFVRFQRALKSLKENGVLLALVSKNNQEDALEAIRKHPDMALKLEDFVTYRINWDPKPQNLISISKELGLTVDSFVFFDDSDFERQMMRDTIPEVEVINVPADPAYYVQALSDYPGFDSLHVTTEDHSRTEMYHAEFERTRLQKKAVTQDDFFRDLQMRAFIQEVNIDGLVRVHQLINKTNQFNLTTKRYTESQLAELLRSERFALFAIRLQDKLGESGTIGVMIVEKQPNQWRLDSFLLSCRIIGRTLEFALMRWLTNKAKEDGVANIWAEFVPTRKNNVAKDFLAAASFESLKNGKWQLNLEKHPKLPKDYVTVV
ncbi:MAG: HAD-IIIC family phosphatase, partial [Nitrososphaerales archaeon]